MKKLALFCLFISFLFCYLEWPPDNRYFVYEIAYELLFQKSGKADAFSHPLVILPFLGQLLALIAIFLPNPKRWMAITAIALMGTLVLMLLIVGALGLNWKILVAVVPFVGAAVWCLRLFKKS
ncbi:MAG: hypothetical protein IPN76_13665 [Saprospiraceae bacterium]|nr:hypothetical protein [Saprospiraceae bacterium]